VPLYAPGQMKEFADKTAPGLFSVILQSILWEDPRLSEEHRVLEEKRTCFVVHNSIFHVLSKTKFLNFGWPLNRGKDNNDNNETLIVTTLLALYSWKTSIKFNHVFKERKLLLIVLLPCGSYRSCPYISRRNF